jgi:hypothetical protein
MTAFENTSMAVAMPASTIPSQYEDSIPLVLGFQPNWPVRQMMFRLFGTSLILGASAIWVMPGSNGDTSLILMKLGISIFFLFCGLALVMINHPDNQPDAYFDPIRREVRVLQMNDKGRPQTVLRRSYDTLGSVRFEDKAIELYDVDGSKLMRLPIASADTRHALRQQLSGVVSIAS